MEKHHRLRRDPSWDPSGCNICGKVGHQAATCPNGTVQWRARLGSDEIYEWWFKPKKLVLHCKDKTNSIAMKKKKKDMIQTLEKRAKLFAKDKEKREEEEKKRTGASSNKDTSNGASAATTSGDLPTITTQSNDSNANGPWVQTVDSQGRKYYWNRATNITSWQPPPGWL